MASIVTRSQPKWTLVGSVALESACLYIKLKPSNQLNIHVTYFLFSWPSKPYNNGPVTIKSLVLKLEKIQLQYKHIEGLWE